MLRIFDIFLTVFHIAIVLFNLLGWIPKATRKAHFISIVLTAGSWFILGFWYGIGYCPFTEWQWNLKKQLGETNVPGNFIEYIVERASGFNFDTQLVSNITGIIFFIVASLSVYLTFIHPARKKMLKSI